jgi:regulator of cell morphogenesis and NO signaling
MSTTIDVNRSLGDLVAELPARARVLERAGLDYCCKGRRSLADAATESGLDPYRVADDLAAVTDTTDVEVDSLSPVELTDHIVATHHAYLDDELPALDALAAKVVNAHASRHPELIRMAELVVTLRAEIEPHLAKEEQVLFPAIARLAGGTVDDSVTTSIDEMMREHDQAGELLAELRATSADYDVPADGCNSYRALYDRLATLEADTHRHIHLENNVLVPAVQALIDQRTATAG